MSELDRLDPEAQAIIDAAKGDGPSAEDKTRIKAALLASLSAAPQVAEASPSPAGLGAGAKLGLGALGMVGMLVGAIALQQPEPAPTAPVAPKTTETAVQAKPEPVAHKRAVADTPPTEKPAPTEPSVSVRPSMVPPPEKVVSAAERSQKSPSPKPRRRARPKRSAPVAPPKVVEPIVEKVEKVEQPKAEPTPQMRLAAETRLLLSAQRALKSDPRRALTLAQSHKTRFKNGVLVEERLATETRAHCALGHRDQARSALAALRKLAPHSSHLGAVIRACRKLGLR